MKIVIAGAGAVGTHLAKLLSREKQDIILMDENEERLSALGNNFDLMTVTASPTSIKGLEEVRSHDADLFIAVTPDESRNVTACMLARSLGAQKTVARIDNYEYLLPKNKEFFQKLGVDSLIYPEMLAAKEIVSSVRMSWVRQWWEFCGGALILMGAKMREKAEILDIPLFQLAETERPYHVVAIKRGNETLIPRGDDVIKLHDIVFFTTTRKYIPYIRKITGKENYADVRNVMIMGGSRIAVRTAQYVPDYMQVKIIESDLARCNRLTELLNDRTMIINGDGRDMDLLIDEGLENTEAFVALTGNSETNILACLAAKRMGVSKTVAEVENIDYIGMAESLDIGTVINKKMIAASHIYQMMLEADVSNLKSLAFANADVAELKVKEGTRITRHLVKDLGFPKGITIGGLVRGGEGVVVEGNTQILPGDHVIVFCLNSMMLKKVEKYFI
ncbi:MAG: Trk system potassium transporter TrkA [Prevotellaceae bacterium]|jgi:trk system potassium uptake protein TrkA|nr:Trk system potassium transporter TrkA [Prevotellaceae bacterium]